MDKEKAKAIEAENEKQAKEAEKRRAKEQEKKKRETPAEETAAEQAPENGQAEEEGASDNGQKYQELNDRYLRLMAEYDNFRKRSQKERDEIYPTATASAVAKFLPVLDNMERAAAFPHENDDFGKGFDMIYQSFQEVLGSLGVEAVGEVGEAFDPAIHNAVMHIEDESLGENVVSQILQKGYKIGDKVIRYAMVQTAN